MTLDRTSRRGRIELAAGLCLLAVVVGAGAGLALRRHTPVDPGLVVAPADLDFGTAWEQPAFRHTFAVTNPTDRPVRVAEIRTGCGCTTVEPQSFTVPPGGRQELTAELDLTGRAGGEAAPFAVELLPNIAHQPPGGRTVWTLRGDVRPNPIIVSEAAIDFGDEYVVGESAPSREIEVMLAEGSAFDDLRAVGLGNPGRVEIQEVGPRKWRLAIAPADGLPAGPFEFSVRIETILDGQGPTTFREIAATGTVRDDVAAWPTAVDFGVLETGEIGEEYVILASHSGRPFEVARIETPGGVTVEPTADQAGNGSRTFVVTQRAHERGDQKGEVMFYVRRGEPWDATGEVVPVRLRASYYGMQSTRKPTETASSPGAGEEVER